MKQKTLVRVVALFGVIAIIAGAVMPAFISF